MVYEDYIIYIYICVCVCVCGGGGGHRASDIHPSFVLGLRPIITCKKNNGDHDNLENHAEDNSVLG